MRTLVTFAAITLQEGLRWVVIGWSELSLLLVAGAVTAAWAASLSNHGDPDPRGHLLSAVKTVAEALPADARVVLRQANEPRWDSCDGRARDLRLGQRFDLGAIPHRRVRWQAHR